MRRAPLILLLGLALVATACGSASTPPPSVSPQHAPTPSRSASATPSALTSSPATADQLLQPGMSGPAVMQVQQRLAVLKYYPGAVDGQSGTDTLEAAWAFQEVQGLPVQDSVSPAMQRALASPTPPGGARNRRGEPARRGQPGR
jgi:N-acetylmuramoyl-L-alanine amidase